MSSGAFMRTPIAGAYRPVLGLVSDPFCRGYGDYVSVGRALAGRFFWRMAVASRWYGVAGRCCHRVVKVSRLDGSGRDVAATGW